MHTEGDLSYISNIVKTYYGNVFSELLVFNNGPVGTQLNENSFEKLN